jgi:ribonuclease HI
MVKSKFYAVAKGRERGVFRTYAECEALVKGFKDAVYKKFETEAAANEFVQSGGRAHSVPLALSPPGAAHSTGAPRELTKRAKSPKTQLPLSTSPSLSDLNSLGPGLDVYVDGACRGNGRDGARGGFGGYYGDDDRRNFALPLASDERQSNNRGELRAIEFALQQQLQQAEATGHFAAVRIHTDSRYCLSGIQDYLPKWKRNGFLTTAKKPVEHMDLWLSIDGLISEYSRRKLEADGRPLAQPAVQFFHVKGHSGNRGNTMADMLAVRGAAMPRVIRDRSDSVTEGPARHRGPRLE